VDDVWRHYSRWARDTALVEGPSER